eukprot:TCONS_00036548-protein
MTNVHFLIKEAKMIIPEAWKNSIVKAIEFAERNKFYCGVINSTLLDSIFKYKLPCPFIPDILVWDPLKATPGHQFFCPEHLSELTDTNQWMDGRDNSLTPRKSFDLTGPALLVGKVYKCAVGKHFVRSTDERIINQMTRHSSDIALTTKYAVKQSYLFTQLQYVINGLSFEKIRNLLKERTLALFYENKYRYILDCKLKGESVDTDYLSDIQELLINMLPCQNTLEDMFKAWFEGNKDDFIHSMEDLSAEILSIDHTFKVCFIYHLKNELQETNEKLLSLTCTLFGLHKQLL